MRSSSARPTPTSSRGASAALNAHLTATPSTHATPDRIVGRLERGAAPVGARRRPRAPRARHRHRRLGADARRGVRRRRPAGPALGTISYGGRVPAGRRASTRSARWRARGRLRPGPRGADRPRRSGAATDLRGLRVGAAHRAPRAGADAPPPPRDERALALVPVLRDSRCRRPARSRLPVPAADTWAAFYAEASGGARGDVPGARRRVRPRGPREARARGRDRPRGGAAGGARARRVAGPRALRDPGRRRGASRRPSALDALPAAHVDELDVAWPFSAYTRAVSHLGWPAIALGDAHLAARSTTLLLRSPRWSKGQ